MKTKYSELGYLLMAVPFIYSLIQPDKNTGFIHDTSKVLMNSEWLAILIAGLSIDEKTHKLIKIGGFAVFTVWILELAKYTNFPQIYYFLILGMITKIFAFNKSPEKIVILRSYVVYLTTFFFIAIFQRAIESLVFIPPPTNGELNTYFRYDNPATTLVWGVLYFVGLYLTGFCKVFKDTKKISATISS